MQRWFSMPVRIAVLAVLVEFGIVAQGWSQEQRSSSGVGEAAEDASQDSSPAQADETADVSLLPDGRLSGDLWKFICRDKESKLAGTWSVQKSDGEAVLVCRGEPYGYLNTTKAFADFQLSLEWKFPVDENGNSGILLYTNGHEKDKIWPTAIQVQLHQPACGAIFPSGDAKTDNEIRDVRDACKTVNQWNSCEITSIAGRISVEMNGKKVGVVTGCTPQKGGIALQSEGSEIHFRRIRVKELRRGDVSLRSVGWSPASCIWTFGADRFLAFPPPEAGPGATRITTTVKFRRPHSHRMSSRYVVYRNPLAANHYSLRVRHHERLMVDLPAAASVSHYDIDLRGRNRRHLHR